MNSRWLRRSGVLAVLAQLGAGLPAEPASAAPAPRPAKAGYAVGAEQCGQAPLAFPKIRIDMRPGYCAGLVASNDDRLVWPRQIVQIPDTRLFVVVDMGGWDGKRGRVLRLDPEAPEGKRLTVLLRNLEVPHGLAVGIDRRVYASTVDRIFRFDPQAARPEDTVETIVQGLPGLQVALPDGPASAKNNHPLKHFVFDRNGRLYVNIGAPTDACKPAPSRPPSAPCRQGDGDNPSAAIWAFTPPAGGIFPKLNPGDRNPPREIYATGLRNSMALAMHPQFPDAGFVFLQGENARDLEDPMKPHEEINVLEQGRHYGWPYCYDLTTPSPEYVAFMRTATRFQKLCTNTTWYRQPHSLMPPHASPLAMLYYQGDKFPELAGKLVVGLHGYKPTGSRIVFFDVDAQGLPVVSPAPVQFGVSCAPPQTYKTDREGEVAAAVPHELVTGWQSVPGKRPRGSPVGITVASDGAIWLVDDKNPSIIRIDTDTATPAPLGCDTRTEAHIAELIRFVANDRAKTQRLTEVRTGLIEKHCMSCHSDFGLPGVPAAQKNAAVLRYILQQDGWVFPGDHASGRLHERVWGKGAGKVMPDDGRELAANASYRGLLTTLDTLVDTIVPGERRQIKVESTANLRNRSPNDVCGALPDGVPVTVVDRAPREKPGFARIYRPADKYLNGQCTDAGGYYVSTRLLAAP